jgi:ketosteroid isomerase-like protein
MKQLLLVAGLMLAFACGVTAETPPAADAAELTKLLREFLAGASRDDAAMHDRFWAEEVIYTGSGGKRRGKPEIMQDVRAAGKKPKADEPQTTYTAEDIRIQQYGDTAIVAFRLVGTTEKKEGGSEVKNYLNTGTFLKRNGKWQVVAWQATVLPEKQD